ncbi:amidohydrolase/deacetylase family metallohydrolase [Halanaerobium kushneri]|uniref:Dihydroorotase n=1 Tax=Halanaerobium kushneri TaxID=56779 RepID=A0A1N6S3A1_9FIRM|nr:amidohydrolase/deacetylase family metallohydrolase [Halanaerobium kushneri]SIQ35623.1 dihydroorotase [Halanaerobium kushneri]
MTTLIKNFKLIGFNKSLQNINEFYLDQEGCIREKPTNNEIELKILDLEGNYLSPGWIDLHTHIYYGVSNLGLNPDLIGPKTGVTVLNDTGSAGEANFLGFKKYIIEPRNYPIYAFINLGSTGLIKSNQISELNSLEMIDLDNLYRRVEANREYIRGIKLRASGVILQGMNSDIVKLAKAAAREVSLPLMVHVGEPLPLLEDILPYLDPGDIVTHIYHGKRWGIYRNNEFLKEYKEALEKRIKFDVGHGAASFNFEVARKAFAAGYFPDTISTDLHTENINGPVWDLSLTMSKLMELGMNLEQIIEAVTVNAADILKIDSFQSEFYNSQARFTVFRKEECQLEVFDSNNNRIILHNYLRPVKTMIGSKVYEADSRFKIE